MIRQISNQLNWILFTAKRYFFRIKLLFPHFSLPETSALQLSFAGLSSGKKAKASGGRLKIFHLKQEFNWNEKSFNFLYLVSSVLTPFALEWARQCKKSGIKLVWNQNGVGYPAWAGPNFNRINNLMKEFIHQADFVIYQSHFCKSSADKFLGNVQSPSIVLYNCVDMELFKPRQTILPLTPFKLLVAGSLEQPDRLLIALEALKLLRMRSIPAILIMAGRLLWPDAKKKTLETIHRLRLTEFVELTGAYSQSDAPALFQNAHTLIHLQYNDACPTVILEALACGLPVVASKSGGIPELLPESCGKLLEVPVDWHKMHYPTPESTANAVAAIIRSWESTSKNARSHALEHFGKTEWINQHRKIFNNLGIKVSSCST